MYRVPPAYLRFDLLSIRHDDLDPLVRHEVTRAEHLVSPDQHAAHRVGLALQTRQYTLPPAEQPPAASLTALSMHSPYRSPFHIQGTQGPGQRVLADRAGEPQVL